MAVLGATSLTGCTSIPSFMGTGARTTFRMATTPVSWTKDTAVNTGTLRVVNGSVSPGGSLIWDQVFTTRPYSSAVSPATDGCSVGAASGTIGLAQNNAHPSAVPLSAVDTTQITAHAHPGVGLPGSISLRPGAVNSGYFGRVNTAVGSAGGGGQHQHQTSSNGSHTHAISPESPHTHVISGSHDHSGYSGSVDFNLTYVDVIVATKD